MGTRDMIRTDYCDAIDALVIAFCYGYRQRKLAIEEKRCKRRTLMEYEYINRRLEDAAREIVGDDFEIYIKEIGSKIGYAHSEIADVSETEYKMHKKEVKISIAKILHLLD